MRIAQNVLRTAFFAAVFAVAWPQLVALPLFRQNPLVLQSAIAVARNAWPIEMACAVAALVALFALGFARRHVLTAAGVILCAGLARVDIFTLIFHPLDRPTFATAAETTLDAREKLLAVSLRGQVRGYPVRSLSYHHIVNDVLEGVAVAATY